MNSRKRQTVSGAHSYEIAHWTRQHTEHILQHRFRVIISGFVNHFDKFSFKKVSKIVYSDETEVIRTFLTINQIVVTSESGDWECPVTSIRYYLDQTHQTYIVLSTIWHTLKKERNNTQDNNPHNLAIAYAECAREFTVIRILQWAEAQEQITDEEWVCVLLVTIQSNQTNTFTVARTELERKEIVETHRVNREPYRKREREREREKRRRREEKKT